MADCSEVRAWGELIPDALGMIFRNLPLQEILTVVPRVCKSWRKAVLGPYCWQEIDINDWSEGNPDQVDQMLRMLITQSRGSCRRLSVSGLRTESMLTFIAEQACSLQKLELPRSEISDSIVEQLAPRFSNIIFLELSYCNKIGPKALEAFGKNCKFLVELRRRMHPVEVLDKVCQDEEAYAIANTMPKLRRLETVYMPLTTRGVLAILLRCVDLQHLDLRGCWDVKLDEKYLMEHHPRLNVLGPDILDTYEPLWDARSDYSDSSSYTWDMTWELTDFVNAGFDLFEASDNDGIWDDDPGLEGLEVRFYGGGLINPLDGLEWPSSP